jgi:hypothetical protein
MVGPDPEHRTPAAVLAKYLERQEPPRPAPIAPVPVQVRIHYLPGTLLDADSVRAAGEH